MEWVQWILGRDSLPGTDSDLFWGWGTLSLSVLLICGYLVIAFNWCLQRRMERTAEAKKAIKSMAIMVIVCAVLSLFFWEFSLPWTFWRIYDLLLLVGNIRTWHFICRMRGLSLVDAQLNELKRIQADARHYREMAEFLPHIVWTADEHGVIDFMNHRWFEYTGDSRSWMDCVAFEQQAGIVNWWKGVIEERRPVSREIILYGLAGPRSFLLTATPVIQGNSFKWLGAFADIEDQKLLATERERQASQRAFLLNALGHDLRSPLQSVISNAQLLPLAPSKKEVVCAANTIIESAMSLNNLVTKLLDYAKAGGQQANEISAVSLSVLLNQIERRYKPACDKKGLFLNVDRSLDLEVQTDRTKVERIVSNLVDNAIKFTQRGGVSLEVVRQERAVIVRVFDTGIGVPEKHVPYLFDEFYQVNNHERDSSKGFGMGLAICRCLAGQIGGEVRLASTGPEGTCFELVISVSDDSVSSGRRPVSEAGDEEAADVERLCSV